MSLANQDNGGPNPARCLPRVIMNNVSIPVYNSLNEDYTFTCIPLILNFLLDEAVLNMYRHTLIQNVPDDKLQSCFSIEIKSGTQQFIDIIFNNRDSLHNMNNFKKHCDVNPQFVTFIKDGNRIAQGIFLNQNICQIVGWQYIYKANKKEQKSQFIIRIAQEFEHYANRN